jgi:hypothetical protein
MQARTMDEPTKINGEVTSILQECSYKIEVLSAVITDIAERLVPVSCQHEVKTLDLEPSNPIVTPLGKSLDSLKNELRWQIARLAALRDALSI